MNLTGRAACIAAGFSGNRTPRTMRIAFLFVILAGALFYGYVAFVDLPFMTRTGRLAAGFFPRVIAVSAVVITLWTLIEELRNSHDDEHHPQTRDVVVLIALALGYGVLMRLFGGFPATVIFLGIALSYFDRGRYVRNAVTAVLVPTCVYLLFDKLLNASMPPALFELPI